MIKSRTFGMVTYCAKCKKIISEAYPFPFETMKRSQAAYYVDSIYAKILRNLTLMYCSRFPGKKARVRFQPTKHFSQFVRSKPSITNLQ